MKINWGTKLIIFTVLFMSFIVSMIVVISNQDVPLVEENYYEKGLTYQKQIDQNESLKDLVRVDFVNDSVFFRNGSDKEIQLSKIEFYRPSDPALDQHQFVKVISTPGQTSYIALPSLASGKWKMKLNWEWDSTWYSIEKEFDR